MYDYASLQCSNDAPSPGARLDARTSAFIASAVTSTVNRGGETLAFTATFRRLHCV